jgi:hypothetical protein
MEASRAAIPTALFLILSSTPAYHLTNRILPFPTQLYGAPTQAGMMVHAAIFFLALWMLTSS